MKEESNYSNRELDAHFTRFEEILNSHHIEVKNDIKELDKKISYTNGKVASISKWREQVVGASKLVGWVGFGTILLYSFHLVNLIK